MTASVLFAYTIGTLYIGALAIIAIYSLNALFLTCLTWRHRHNETIVPQLQVVPTVTVQLPIYNELYVVERLIEAACELNWINKNLEIQILDDSTDETTEVIRRVVLKQREAGKDIQHIHRSDRAGYKAGALQEGLQAAKGEFVAIFDADFIPPQDFLEKTIPLFHEPDIAFVQSRWGYLNDDYSILTRMQCIMLDGHFIVEQFARSRAGYFFNFNGTAGVWRKAAIESSGGWQHDTLTEDLDLSYRAFLSGWRAIYLHDVVAKSELPVTIAAYRRQQYRWARGCVECSIKLLPQIMQKPIGIVRKIQAIFHLTTYLSQIALLLVCILYPIIIYTTEYLGQLSLVSRISFYFTVAIFTQIAYFVFVLSRRDNQRTMRKNILLLLIVFIFGAGMVINVAISTGQALLKLETNFERTPKYGIKEKKQLWANKQYFVSFNGLIKYEIAMISINLCTALFSFQNSYWPITFFTLSFTVGLLLTTGWTIIQEIQLRAAVH